MGELATGTGIFLVELAETLPPTTTFQGYDISPDLFPRDAHRPSNVSFNLIDIKKPFPESMHAKFDVVHIRLIISILQPKDWIMIARNVFSILKPGGAIMWVELDVSHLVRSVRGDTGADNPRSHGRVLASNFADLLQIMPWMLGGDMTRLTSTFAEAGFENCEEDVVSTDRQPGEREFSSRLNLDGWYQAAHGMLAKGVSVSWDSTTIEERMEEAKKEIEAGAYCRTNLHCTIGFKPK